MQVSNWFINARVRLWKPMVEEMYLEELKEKESAAAADENDVAPPQNQNNPSRSEDHKPSHDQLVRIDSECLSSIIDAKKSKSIHADDDHHFGAMELDFSGGGGGHSYGGGGVSLTLGLHQHGEAGGVSLAFATAPSLFYARDQMEECQTATYSLLESENQSLQYRNLMGAQLLHDLAG